MTDFLEQLGDQLRRAEQTDAPAVQGRGQAAAAPGAGQRRRWALGVVALAAAGALAVALVVSSSRATSKPPASQLAILGVLHRPQNAQDLRALREAGLSRTALAALAPRLGYVRLLKRTTDRGAALVSYAGPGLSVAQGAYAHRNDLCLLFSTPSLASEHRPKAGHRARVLCGNTATILDGAMVASAGTALLGLVPDGVTRVTYTSAQGRILNAPVHENFFWIEGAIRSAGAGPGSSFQARQLDAKPRRKPVQVEWRGPTGARLGPPAVERGLRESRLLVPTHPAH